RSAAALWEGWFAADLVVEGGRCRGVRALDPSGRAVELRATHTLMASGGAGQLFSVTTNPAQSTGDGVAMALRAGVAVADVEFMQFHPTGLHGSISPRPLLSEAVRGEGALLRDGSGRRFVDELAPRDVVSAAMMARMVATGAEHLWLDATAVEGFARLFPTLHAVAGAVGLDPSRDWLPVAPAAHYLCGGILTDLDGASELAGLWAAGEAAASGVHGANRLASNSLLEGMVFGARVVEAIVRGKDRPDASGALRGVLERGRERPGGIGVTDMRTGTPVGWPALPVDAAKAREQLQQAMTTGAGVWRNAATLAATAERLDALAPPCRGGAEAAGGAGGDPAELELANLLTVARALLAGALARAESRGCHRRDDRPDPSPRFLRRFVQ
ncbi:MAG: FAD-binding protein, partial [Acidimicrobiales bacterium]